MKMKLKKLCFAVLAAYFLSGINVAHAAAAAQAVEPITLVDDPLAIPDDVKQTLRDMFSAEGFTVYLKQLHDDGEEYCPCMEVCPLPNKICLLSINTVAQNLFSGNPFVITVKRDDEYDFLEEANKRLHFDPHWPNYETCTPHCNIHFSLTELYANALHEVGHIASKGAEQSILSPEEIEMMRCGTVEVLDFPELAAIPTNAEDMRIWKRLGIPYSYAPKERAPNALSRMRERQADYFIIKSNNENVIQAFISTLEKIEILEDFFSLRTQKCFSLKGEEMSHPTTKERIVYCKEALKVLQANI